jgi:excisionase family DNA binding protein
MGWLTIEQAAKRLGVHRDTLRKAIAAGRVPAVQIGDRGIWRLPDDFEARLVGGAPAVPS